MDRTREIVAALAREDHRIRLVDNPGRIPARGLNRAIAESTGEVVARVDGHAELQPGYIRRCVLLLDQTNADDIGGTMAARGESPLGEAIACATMSPVGVGGARYRYSKRAQVTDTVWPGCYRRGALEGAGMYDGGLVIHEDYELNARIRSRGGRIVFSPELSTTYWVRESWRALWRQYHRYGRAKGAVARRSPAVVRPYHLIPPAFVVVLVSGTVIGAGSRRGRPLVASALAAYLGVCAVAGAVASRGRRVAVRARVPAVLVALHLAWGSGFWRGLATGPEPVPTEGDSERTPVSTD